jgi:SAM-dependent methyltransferase
MGTTIPNPVLKRVQNSSTVGTLTYTLGNTASVLKLLSRRSLYVEGKFVLPYLSKASVILDCGCGPGSFTKDFARLCSAFCVGVDIDPVALNYARHERTTLSSSIADPNFVVGRLESLPFHDNAFDFGFCHTVLMQFASPGSVLREVSRVLKPKALFAIREPVLSRNIYLQSDNPVARFFSIFAAMRDRDGGDANVGSKVPNLLIDCGFRLHAKKIALQWQYGSNLEAGYRLIARIAESADFLDRAVNYGIISKVAREKLSAAIASKTNDRSALYASAFVEVIAETV